MEQDYYSIFTYIALWLLLFLTLSKFCSFWSTTKVIVATYTFFSVMAYLLMDNPYFQPKYQGLTTAPFIYLFLFIIISIIPIIKYDATKPETLISPSFESIKYFLYVYILVSVVVLPQSFTNIQEGLTRLMSDSTAGAEMYAETHESEADYHSPIFGAFSAFHNCFFETFVFLTFLMYCSSQISKWYLIVLSSIILFELLAPIAAGLRTMTIMKVFTMLAAVTFFFPFWSKNIKHLFSKICIALIGITAIPFLALTVSRFGDRDAGTSGEVVRYMGEAPLNFNIYCYGTELTREGDRTCNMFKRWLGYSNVPEDVNETRMVHSAMELGDESFSTHVGDFVLDFGVVAPFVGMLILTLIIFIATYARETHIYSHQIFLLYLVSCITLQGSMYLFYYSYKENYTIISFMIAYIFLIITENISKPIYFTRQ